MDGSLTVMVVRRARGRKSGRPGIRQSRVATALVLCLVATCLPAAVVDAGIYRFIDSEGNVHYSDVPYDSRYRLLENMPRELALSGSKRPTAPVQHSFDSLISSTARAHGVDPALVKAVIAAESNFQIEAVSRVGAQGLMQLMPATAAELGVRAPLEPVDNVRGGVRYLKAMLDRYGDIERALAAYNAGPAAVDRHGGIPPFRETQAYVKRVLNYYRGYQGHFPR